VLGACPTRAMRIAIRITTHLRKRDSVRSPTLRATDGKNQFTAAPFQLASVPRRLMVALEPAPVTTTPRHVFCDDRSSVETELGA
jgi:hypothetical protein